MLGLKLKDFELGRYVNLVLLNMRLYIISSQTGCGKVSTHGYILIDVTWWDVYPENKIRSAPILTRTVTTRIQLQHDLSMDPKYLQRIIAWLLVLFHCAQQLGTLIRQLRRPKTQVSHEMCTIFLRCHKYCASCNSLTRWTHRPGDNRVRARAHISRISNITVWPHGPRPSCYIGSRL